MNMDTNITTDEAIKLLELATKPRVIKEIELSVAPDVTDKFLEAINMAIEALGKSEPHWIPVTEEPKKEEKSYWVCLEDGGQCQCRWTNDVYGLGANEWSKWGWKKVDLPRYSKVVAYMPLPEPYKGVTE